MRGVRKSKLGIGYSSSFGGAEIWTVLPPSRRIRQAVIKHPTAIRRYNALGIGEDSHMNSRRALFIAACLFPFAASIIATAPAAAQAQQQPAAASPWD